MDEQQRRFQERIDDERKIWKLSPMNTESFNRWYDYSRARDAMFEATDTDFAPWYIVPADSQKRARLNCISHLPGQIPYKTLPRARQEPGKRKPKGKYDDQASLEGRRFVPETFQAPASLRGRVGFVHCFHCVKSTLYFRVLRLQVQV